MTEHSQDPYAGILEKLHAMSWPRTYLYKFILSTDRIDGMQEIAEIVKPWTHELEHKFSKNKNFVSISIRVAHMESPEHVVDIYKKVGKIEGVISL